MIADRFVEYLHNNVVGFTLGTRNSELEPSLARPMGGVVSDDRKYVTIYLPEVAVGNNLKNLEDNGQVSLNLGAMPSHEAYQFKGIYTTHAPCDAHQIEQMGQWITKFKKGMLQMGYPEPLSEAMDNLIVEPAIAITFEVKEIYEQTPKPGTGNKIDD